MDLREYIGEETSYDEFLEPEDRESEIWLKSVSAFANTDGGALILAISDQTFIVGIDAFTKDSRDISRIIKSRIEPTPEIDIKKISVEGKNYILVYVESGMRTPYYLVDGERKTAYVRIHDESRPATRFALKSLIIKEMELPFDTLSGGTQKVFASFSDLGGKYYSLSKKTLKEKDLYSFGLIGKDGILTNAGELFGDQHLIDHSKIYCTRWKGTDKQGEATGLFKEREFCGGLTVLLDSVINYLKIHTKKMWRKGTKNREKHPEYPETAVIEAVVNALAHRDYNISDDYIRIDLYDDRMEIYSPGGMYNGRKIQKQDPYDIASIRRNPIVCDVFSRMNLMERNGSGLKKIIESYKSKEYYSDDLIPTFESTDTSFLVVLKNLNYNFNKNKDKEEDVN